MPERAGAMADYSYPQNTSLILVAVVTHPRDLEIARLLGWYRIPLRSAPKVIAVDFLAFYQTAAFEGDKWQIKYVAPVRGHELVTRAELLIDEVDHPHASQEYYKIQIGTLLPLEHPIPAGRWRRITFFYTTGEYLNRASTISELVVQSEERRTLWKALRERASIPQEYSIEGDPGMDVDPLLLAEILGIDDINKLSN
jgi:hypothetical protein